MAIDKAGEENTGDLAFLSDHKEVLILTKQYTLQRGLTIEQPRIFKTAAPVFLSREHRNAPSPHASG